MCKRIRGGEQFFEELDRDGDERVTVEDVKVALRKRGLPDAFAAKFVQSTRGNHWWSNSIGCAGPHYPCCKTDFALLMIKAELLSQFLGKADPSG